MDQRVLVTGGAGFIGSNIVRRLVEGGEQVRVFDNFSTGTRANLDGLESDVEVIEGELRSYERVHAAMRGQELIYHQGALPSVPRSLQDPLTTNAVNVDGTLNVLLAARDQGARRIVFASSSSVYGNEGPLPRVESAQPKPASPYAVSKLAAEGYCGSFSRAYSLETVSLRYFNVFGPNQDPSSPYAAVVPRFILAIASGSPVPVHGDGAQTRDFTYVSDVVEAAMLAAEYGGPTPDVLNVAAGGSVTIEVLADAIGAQLGIAVRKRYLPPRPDEVRHSRADISKARRMLGFEPRVTLEQGLAMAADGLLDRALALEQAD